jgi:Kef-type K+ transport system membrane component KefB
VLLLFLIGLETDLQRLLSVGGAAFAVAVVGVVLPFAAGYGVGLWLDYPVALSIFLGATLTATSVGITARVLSDLGHLQSDEAQVILGAAVVDDILGLILLAVVSAIAAGQGVTAGGVARITAVAFGFVVFAVLVGQVLAPWLVRLVTRVRVAKALFFFAVTFAFTLAAAAAAVGSALIIGAFAAGLVLARTEKGHTIEREVHDVAQFFIPIFFVMVGAGVDLRSLNPAQPETRHFLLVGLLLTVVAITGKLAAGLAAFGRPLRRGVVGVGMVPRGEVGLIFAQLGRTMGLLSAGLYSSVALMVMITTFVTPPVLRAMLVKREPRQDAGTLAEVVSETMSDRD